MVYKNCTLPDGRQVDIEVQNGTITALEENISAKESTDVNGAYLLPKLVDLHVKLKDGILNAPNMKKIVKEAKKGGVGYMMIMPQTTPPIDNEISLEFTQNTLKEIKDIKIDIAINALQEDLSLSNIAILLKKGAKNPYISTIAKNNIAIKIAEYVKMYNTILFCKAEDNSLKSQGVMFDGDVSSKLGLSGIPELSEVVHVSRMIEIARYYGVKILFKAIAIPQSLEMISKAKEEGVDVKAEVSLHHLLHSDKACEGFNTIAKIDPPLVDEISREKLITALKNGSIDMLSVLHQPNSPVNKEVAFFDASYGSSALSDALALYYTKLVKSGIISMQKLIELTVINPRKTVGLKIPVIEIGESINQFLLFNKNESYMIKENDSLYKSDIVFGKVQYFEEN